MRSSFFSSDLAARLFLYVMNISLTEMRNTAASTRMSWVNPWVKSDRENNTNVIAMTIREPGLNCSSIRNVPPNCVESCVWH